MANIMCTLVKLFFLFIAFAAETIVPIKEYHGPCRLTLSKKAINIASTLRNEDLGTWPYDCIRKFHSQDLHIFSFTSGRRGPYGVKDYSFRLKEIDLIQLQQLLSQNTGNNGLCMSC